MREEFVDTWKSAKASSPKLEFYNQIKHEFEPETYLGVVKFPDARKSLTRFRIILAATTCTLRGADTKPP